MITEIAKPKIRNSPVRCLHPGAVNLYRFICLMVGPDIPRRHIARRWKMDEKNFYELSIGNYPVPRIKRLIDLAKMLGVNKHLVFEVAGGAPAGRIFKLIKNNDLPGQMKLIFGK